ncbi:MAG: DNA alkylation repair protein [Coriobacteriia bacterium]|nr:DNA alkylation repair protein [Coriobacteriia bacterium]
MNEILSRIRQDLLDNADQDGAVSAQRLFKDNIKTYGIKAKTVNRISRLYLKEAKTAGLTKNETIGLCEGLLSTGFQEEAMIAFSFAEALRKQSTADDIDTFAKWIEKYVDNWAKCDTLCNHTIGNLLMDYPQLIDCLVEWAKSKNRWLKRAAAVSLIIPVRKGMFFQQAFLIADTLLKDPDDMVQKGYGWMLKSISEHDTESQRKVFDYVVSNKPDMPRTALRYAIEKMPNELKQKAMAK